MYLLSFYKSYLVDAPRDIDPVLHGHGDIDENVLRSQLEELWDVERDGEDDDGEDVPDDADPALPAVDAVVILHGSGDSQISTRIYKQLVLWERS